MEANQHYSNPTEDNLVSQLWAKYFPYWPVFILLIGLFIAGAWAYTRTKLPVYESSATLLIKDEKKGTEDSKMAESFNLLSTKKIIENEIEIIKSRALMTQVIQDLKLYAPVYATDQWKDVPVYTTSPVKIEALHPDSLIEAGRIDFRYDATRQQLAVAGKTYPLNTWVSTPWGTLRFSENNKAYAGTAPLYFKLVHPKRITKDLIKKLDVSSVSKLSSVINLKIKDEVPQRSEDILNTLIRAYEKAAINDKNVLAANTLAFLDERLQYVSGDLATIEKQLQQYKARQGAVDISSQGRLFLQNVSDNDQKLSDVDMQRAVLDQIEKYILSKDSRGSLAPSTLGVDDPLLTSLLTKLYDSELQYEKLKRTMGEDNLEVVTLLEQTRKIKVSILENIHSQQRSLEARKSSLFSTNKTYTSLLQSLPQQERDLVEISRKQEFKKSIYNFLLQKREEATLSHSATVSDSRVVDQAESTIEPVGLSNKLIYLIAGFLGLGFGIAGVTARELFNRKVLFRREIETLTSFPVIGEIVRNKSKSPLIIEEGRKSLIAEQFRLLRTSLSYLRIGEKRKKLLVTSTLSGEGKSFVAANLAVSLAMTGKKVVLLELDLSNPTLSYKLGMDTEKGISEYLMDEVEPEEVIKRTVANPNLFLMPAGGRPANPSELIVRSRMKELFYYLEEIFDYIIVDSAPVGLLSDGYILSRHCDATLYVVRHKYTPKKMLERLEHNNKINELKNLAIVFNGVSPRGFGQTAYGYGYGYGYTYDLKK